MVRDVAEQAPRKRWARYLRTAFNIEGGDTVEPRHDERGDRDLGAGRYNENGAFPSKYPVQSKEIDAESPRTVRLIWNKVSIGQLARCFRVVAEIENIELFERVLEFEQFCKMSAVR